MIIMYHGLNCPHCRKMMPLIDKLEKEEGIKIEKKEVWHDEKNANEMRSKSEIIKKSCEGSLGTPTFLSNKTNNAICGEKSYEEFKKWVEENN